MGSRLRVGRTITPISGMWSSYWDERSVMRVIPRSIPVEQALWRWLSWLPMSSRIQSLGLQVRPERQRAPSSSFWPIFRIINLETFVSKLIIPGWPQVAEEVVYCKKQASAHISKKNWRRTSNAWTTPSSAGRWFLKDWPLRYEVANVSVALSC